MYDLSSAKNGIKRNSLFYFFGTLTVTIVAKTIIIGNSKDQNINTHLDSGKVGSFIPILMETHSKLGHRTTLVLPIVGLDGSTIGSSKNPIFSSGGTSNAEHLILTSSK